MTQLSNLVHYGFESHLKVVVVIEIVIDIVNGRRKRETVGRLKFHFFGESINVIIWWKILSDVIVGSISRRSKVVPFSLMLTHP